MDANAFTEHRMTNQLIAISHNLVNIKNELDEIGAKARVLTERGRALLPVKPDMLFYVPAAERDAIMAACELLLASCLQYVDAQLKEQSATNAIDIVAARIERGQADGTVTALIFGQTRMLLLAACQHAPIAMHAIMQSVPELDILKRLKTAQNGPDLKKRLR
jgi:hypothetical protein